jgi:hypothetical protein
MENHKDQKTNVDDVYLPQLLIWLGWMWVSIGFVASLLFVFTALGWQSPVEDVYYSPTFWGRTVYQLLNPKSNQ